MSSDAGRQPGAPHDLPRWAERLQVALQWYAFVLVGTLLLATNTLPIHLTGRLQRLVDGMVIAEFVVFLPAAFILVVVMMRRYPATNRLQAWGGRLLVIGVFGFSVLTAYWFITDYFSPEWRRSSAEILALAALGAVMFALWLLGLVLVVMALSMQLWQVVSSRHRHPSANAGD
jgi:hypothetical protein